MEGDKTGRVMIVDQDPRLEKLVAKWLEMSGFFPPEGVLIANNLEAASGNLEQIDDKPRLIIVDPWLQNAKGIAFLENLKLNEPGSKFKDTVVVVFSAHDDPAVKDKWISLGVNGIISKPASMKEFVAGLQEAIANKRGTNE